MRIDLPSCNLKNCRYEFDYNCINKREYETCQYAMLRGIVGNGWIPVEMGLPKMYEEHYLDESKSVSDFVMITILCCNKNKIVTDAMLVNGTWQSTMLDMCKACNIEAKVIAWMPFPQPYKEIRDD